MYGLNEGDNMTGWNLAYDYVATFLILLVVVWYMTERRVPVKAHRAFLVLVSVVFVATCTEIAATHMALGTSEFDSDMVYLVIDAQNVFLNLVAVAFAYYILQLGHIDVRNIRLISRLFNAAVVVDVAVGVVNYFTRTAFSFEDGRYRILGMSYIWYALDSAMIIISVVVLIRHVERFNFLRTFALLFNVICGVVGCALQVVMYQPLINFFLSTLCLTLYYYVHNPSNVTDPVTKQFNRKFMGEYVTNLFTSGKRFAVIALAMDDFKFINKTYGVGNGDNLLLQVGSFLETVKAGKTVFRFGSDQFCVIINKNVDETDEIAKVIHDRFRHPWFSESQMGIMMSASVCCIECPRDAVDYGELVEVLDYSMSIAKRTSKGKITRASDVNLDRIKQDKAVEKAVKQAMDRDELLVYYQPIFSVNKGVYNSAEALVRLHDDELGWISPEIFIPIAEKNGLIIEMGEMILNKVCRFIHDFNLSETTVEYIEVNISPVQLMQQNFTERVKSIMGEYDVKPSQINIEITETATMTSSTAVRDNIEKLIEYGVSFSLDDYGSGNANIDYINHMPFKIIKLDKYIIWDSFKNSKAGITLEYTIGMLNALKLYIVAEGVETEEMKNHLVNIGCHYMQGWYYSKAIADEEFIKLIEKQG